MIYLTRPGKDGTFYQADAPGTGSSSELAPLTDDLKSIRPADLVLVSDMTQTLITQGQGGFTAGQAGNITRLLNEGATLVLATADPIEAVKGHFIAPLNYQGTGKIIVLSTAGHVAHEVLPGCEIVELFRGNIIPLADREALLTVFEEVLVRKLADKISFAAAERALLFSDSGARVNIQRFAADKFGPASSVDVNPGKTSIFFLDNKQATPLQTEIFQEIAGDARVVEIVRRSGLFMFVGGNYLDILSCTKRTGLDQLFARADLQPLFRGKRVLALGDSPNDEGILTHPFSLFATPSLRAFVGTDVPFLTRIRSAVQEKIFFLEGEFTSGTERLLAMTGEAAA